MSLITDSALVLIYKIEILHGEMVAAAAAAKNRLNYE